MMNLTGDQPKHQKEPTGLLEDLEIVEIEGFMEKKAAHYYDRAAGIAGSIGDKPSEGKWLSKLGDTNRELGDTETAIKNYKKAIRIIQTVKDKKNERILLTKIGDVVKEEGKITEASTSYEKAVEIAKFLGEITAEEKLLGKLGRIHFEEGDWEKAMSNFEEALALSQKAMNKRNEAKWFFWLGQLYTATGAVKKALKSHEQAVKISKEVSDKKQEGLNLASLGDNYHHILKEFSKAIESYQEAIKIAKLIGDRITEAEWLGMLADVYFDTGEISEAKNLYERSARIAKYLDDKLLEIQLGKIGVAYHKMEDHSKASDYLTRAIIIAKLVGDEENELNWLEALAMTKRKLGLFDESIALYNEILQDSRAVTDKRRRALLTLGLGRVYEESGDSQVASNWFEKALKIAKDTKIDETELEVLISLGNAYFELDKMEKALDNYGKAIKLAKSINDAESEIVSLEGLAKVNEALNEHKKAIELYSESLAIAKRIKNKTAEQTQLGNIGNVHYKTGGYPKAITNFNSALIIARDADDKISEFKCISALGDIALAQGKLNDAIEDYNKALGIVKGLGIKSDEGRILSKLATAQDKQGNVKRAIESNLKSLNIINKVEEKPGEKEHKLDVLNKLADWYSVINDYPRAKNHYLMAVEMAIELDKKELLLKLLSNLGKAHLDNKKINDAFKSLEESLNLARELKNKQMQVDLQILLAKTHLVKGKKDSQEIAEDYFSKASKLVAKIDDKDAGIKLLGSIGDSYFDVDRYDLAEQYFKKALDKAVSDINKVAWYLKLGETYLKLENQDRAINNYEKALEMVGEYLDPSLLMEVYAKVASAYRVASQKKKLEEAVSYYEKAIEIAERLENDRYTCHWLRDLGNLLKEMGKPYFVNYERALVIADRIQDDESKGELLASMGHHFLKLGESEKTIDYYKRALDYYKRSINIKRTNNKQDQKLVLINIAGIYKKLGEEERAKEFEKKAKKIK